MKPAILLSILAFIIYMIGAMLSFRNADSKTGLSLMAVGVGLDILIVVLPKLGVSTLKMGITTMNPIIGAAIVLGFLVWLGFGAALILYKLHFQNSFQIVIGLTQIIWFIDILLFHYGVSYQ